MTGIMRTSFIVPCHYIRGKIEYVNLIKGGMGWSHHQGPGFTQYTDGRLCMLWSAYDIHECNNDNVILYSISRDNGETWSEPEVFMAAPGSNVSHVIQAQLRGTEEAIMINRETSFRGAEIDPVTRTVTKWANYGISPSRILIRRSLDLGKTWGLEHELSPEQIVPSYRPPFYGAPESLMQLEGGELLLGICFLPPERRDYQHYHIAFFLSDDKGDTWDRTFILTVPEERGAMEPTVVELGSNELYCLLRNKSGFLYETMSHDAGRSWTDPTKTSIPSPEAICRLLRLRSGKVILIWNNQSSRTQAPRYPLVVTISNDGCKSWSAPRLIATESGRNQLSNFGVVQLNDDRILLGVSHYNATRPTSSDIDLAVFDEEWITSGESLG